MPFAFTTEYCYSNCYYRYYYCAVNSFFSCNFFLFVHNFDCNCDRYVNSKFNVTPQQAQGANEQQRRLEYMRDRLHREEVVLSRDQETRERRLLETSFIMCTCINFAPIAQSGPVILYAL